MGNSAVSIGEATGQLLATVARMKSDRSYELPKIDDHDMASRWGESECNHPVAALSASRMRYRARNDREQLETISYALAVLDGKGPLSEDEGRTLAWALTFEARAAASAHQHANLVATKSIWVARSSGGSDPAMKAHVERVVDAVRRLDRANAIFDEGVRLWPLWRTIGRDSDAMREATERLTKAVCDVCDAFLPAGHGIEWDPRG